MKNKFVLILLILMATISVITLGSAAISWTSPVQGGNYTTTIAFSVATDRNAGTNMSNVTCLYNASGGPAQMGTGGGTFLIGIYNTTNAQTTYTGTATVSSYTQGTAYNISCTVLNLTTVNTTISRSGITIDYTNPAITYFDIKQKSISPNGLIESRCLYTDAIGLAGTGSSFTYTDPAGTSNTLTADGNYKAISQEKTSLEGTYTFTCYAIDRSGNTVTDSDTSENHGFTITIQQRNTLSNIPSWIWIAGIAAVIYYLATKKK